MGCLKASTSTASARWGTFTTHDDWRLRRSAARNSYAIFERACADHDGAERKNVGPVAKRGKSGVAHNYQLHVPYFRSWSATRRRFRPKRVRSLRSYPLLGAPSFFGRGQDWRGY